MAKKKSPDKDLEKAQREKIFKEADKAYAALQKDPIAWQEELKERALWDATLLDGLDEL